MGKRVKSRTRRQTGQRPSAASNAEASAAAPIGARVRAASASAPVPADGEPPVRIRFYCQGIGDCHLLRFSRSGGYFWMLIDCGVHSSVSRGTESINAIVDDIASLTANHLDVIVLTHEHWDHVS